MFVDAIHLKLRDGQVGNRPFYESPNAQWRQLAGPLIARSVGAGAQGDVPELPGGAAPTAPTGRRPAPA